MAQEARADVLCAIEMTYWELSNRLSREELR